ncbi:MAG: peroxide stress protein YaaA [Bacteroidales bacterium]|nr:peroxide stress protein YaaA [Bacteroidales bacterium]
MLIVISPAKKLDYKTQPNTSLQSMPTLLEHSKELIEDLRNCSIESLTKLMNISYGLAETNLERFAEWELPYKKENAKQAVLAFNGDVYNGLNAKTFDDEDFKVAQNKIRIISGLYGLLKPLDLILPYRLPMGTKLSNSRGKNLYEFWGNIITTEINKALIETKSKAIINLASNEYFKAVNKENIDAELVEVVFKENKNGILRVVSFYAKKARGMMANYIVKNKINDVEDLKGFNYEGYSYDESQSTKNKFVFVR